MPVFESTFGHCKTNSNPNKIVSLERLEKPPNFSEVLSWCQQNNEEIATIPTNSVEYTDLSLNKTCVRVRQNSEDSLGLFIFRSTIARIRSVSKKKYQN